MKSRSRYVTMIWMYEQRRSKLDRNIPKDRIKRYSLYKKIRTYRKAIVRIDKRMEVVRNLILKTNAYFSIDIRAKGSGDYISIARFCYYKYGIENGILGRDLALAVGKNKYSASKRRRDFTKSFKTNLSNKEAYHQFKSYMEK